MRIAILIVTYTSSVQTQRLIERLNNGQFDFYIHLDKKKDIKTHENLFDVPNVYFIKDRVDIRWGGYSTARAAFNGVKQIASSGIKYDFINLISGQDYPIKPASYIIETLQNSIGKQFIEYRSFDTEWQEAIARVDKFHFNDIKIPGKHRLQNLLNFFVKRGKMPVDLKLYGVTTFWTLSPDAALYVVNFVEKNKKLNTFLKYTWGTDEFIFQTVLMNSHYKDTLTNTNHTLAEFPPGQARPKFFKTEDFDKLTASEKFFARKFSIDVDENILDMVDDYCLKMENIKTQPDGLYN